MPGGQPTLLLLRHLCDGVCPVNGELQAAALLAAPPPDLGEDGLPAPARRRGRGQKGATSDFKTRWNAIPFQDVLQGLLRLMKSGKPQDDAAPEVCWRCGAWCTASCSLCSRPVCSSWACAGYIKGKRTCINRRSCQEIRAQK